jgi:hypothetical protein
MTWTGDDGQARHYDLADGAIELPVTSGDHKGEVLTLRQVTHRDNPGVPPSPRRNRRRASAPSRTVARIANAAVIARLARPFTFLVSEACAAISSITPDRAAARGAGRGPALLLAGQHAGARPPGAAPPAGSGPAPARS